MKNLILSLVFGVMSFYFFGFSAFAQEQRTNYYTQITVYFQMESVDDDDALYDMNQHTLANGEIKQIMERTDTTMNLQQRGFGPYPLADDPARDSILDAEGHYGKRTLGYRAWSGMNQSLQDPQNPISQKIQQIKDLTGAQTVTIIIMVNADYYVGYSEFNHTQNETPIMVAHSGSKSNHLKFYNQIIFDSTSTKAVGYINELPTDHPLSSTKKNYYTLLIPFSQYTLPIYPRKGYYKDKYGFWLQVGDDNHNVLDPEHGWKLEYLFNKGLLKY